MKWRRKLGSVRIERRLSDDVNLDALSILEPGFRILQADTLSIGGEAPKSFVDFPQGESLYTHAYIAKAPGKHGPRECATEFLISCVAAGLPLRIARSRLVIVPGKQLGNPDVRFLSRYFLHTVAQEILTHGLELVAMAFDMDQMAVQKEVPRSAEPDFYTVDLVEDVLRQIGRNEKERASLLDGLGRMLGFDAIVGANDRHPRNWGIIQSAISADVPYRFAPVFDTARGLFWNSSDEQLVAKTQGVNRQSFLERYAKNSRPLIGTGGSKPANHFDLMRYLVAPGHDKHVASGIRSVLAAFSIGQVERMLHRKFGRIFSRLRLELIRDLLRYRDAALRTICQPCR